jgi:hypothetical protein
MPPPAAPVAKEPRWGEHRRANPPDDDEQMGEINVIFGGSMSIASKTQGKKLEWEISLAQRIEPGRKLKQSDVGILFGPEDHLETELSERNLPFMIKLLIGQHKVANSLIDKGASLNLKDLTPIHDTFYGVIPGQTSTPIGRINLEVSCGTGDNKRKKVLMFEVASFDIEYNYILGRPFLLKFMAVIHTAYVTMKMPSPRV